MAKINLPKIDSNPQDVEYLVDNLLIMRKELEYALMHLNEENVPIINNINSNIGGIKKDVEGNFTSIEQNANEISLVAFDVAGNAAAIVINSDQITLNMSDISGNSSSIIQNSDQISSNISNINGNSSSIIQNSDQISINISNINGNMADIVVNSGQISSNVVDILGNASSINQNSTSISINVSNINSNSSSISQNASNINLRVKKNDVINQINISNESIDIDANKINLNGVTTMTGLAKVSDVLQIGGNNETGVINFPQSGDYDQAFISSDNGTYGLYIHTLSDLMLSSYDDLYISGQDRVEINSKSGPYDEVKIALNSGIGIDIFSPYGVDFNNCDLDNVNDIVCDKVTASGQVKSNGKLVTTPYYTGNICFVDTDGTNIVFRDSSGSTVASITDGAFI